VSSVPSYIPEFWPRLQPVENPWPSAPPIQRDCITQPRHLRDPEYFIGLDLGQMHDPSAIAILERTQPVLGRDPFTLRWNAPICRAVRFLQRIPLDTPYPDIVDIVRDVVLHPEIQPWRRTLILDATGVGKPVVDMFVRAKLPCRLVPVTITSGDRQSCEADHWRVPKRDLITGLLVLFQSEKLQICGQLSEAKVLLNELSNMRVKVSLDGHEKYGAWREGEHDDLVLATALASWREGGNS
jgi:hypothetical protein